MQIRVRVLIEPSCINVHYRRQLKELQHICKHKQRGRSYYAGTVLHYLRDETVQKLLQLEVIPSYRCSFSPFFPPCSTTILETVNLMMPCYDGVPCCYHRWFFGCKGT